MSLEHVMCHDEAQEPQQGLPCCPQTPEGGWGLHQVMQEQDIKLRGIVNGIDLSEWSPEVDKFLDTDGYSRYGKANLTEGKRKCKIALQRQVRGQVTTGRDGRARRC